MTNVFQRLRPCSNPEINTIIQFKVVVPLVSSQVTLQIVWQLPHLCIALCIAIINLDIYYSYGL
jgi:hypothetical protein